MWLSINDDYNTRQKILHHFIGSENFTMTLPKVYPDIVNKTRDFVLEHNAKNNTDYTCSVLGGSALAYVLGDRSFLNDVDVYIGGVPDKETGLPMSIALAELIAPFAGKKNHSGVISRHDTGGRRMHSWYLVDDQLKYKSSSIVAMTKATDEFIPSDQDDFSDYEEYDLVFHKLKSPLDIISTFDADMICLGVDILKNEMLISPRFLNFLVEGGFELDDDAKDHRLGRLQDKVFLFNSIYDDAVNHRGTAPMYGSVERDARYKKMCEIIRREGFYSVNWKVQHEALLPVEYQFKTIRHRERLEREAQLRERDRRILEERRAAGHSLYGYQQPQNGGGVAPAQPANYTAAQQQMYTFYQALTTDPNPIWNTNNTYPAAPGQLFEVNNVPVGERVVVPPPDWNVAVIGTDDLGLDDIDDDEGIDGAPLR